MQDCTEITKRLKGGGESEEIREAAWQAGESECREAVSALAELLTISNLGIQEAADIALRKIGGSETVAAVVPLLRSDDAPVRNLSMDILREVGHQDLTALMELMHDKDADVRIFISDILGSTDSNMAVTPLGDALLKDPEVNVRYQAAVSLGNLGKKEAARFLNKALEDEEWIQFAVIEALSKIRDDSSVGALANALTKSSDLVASMIVEALGEMGNVKAVTILMKHMDSSPTALRNKIVKAIVRILGGKSLQLLGEKDREKFREYLLVAITDEEKDIQDASIQGLGFVGGEKASCEVLKLAETMDFDQDQERVRLCVDALLSIGLNKSLEEGLTKGSYKAAKVAIEVLSQLGGEQALKLMTGIFWDSERDLQRDLIVAVAACANEDSKDFFLDVLAKHNDGTIIKATLEFLGQLGLEETGEALFGFLEHPYDDVKEVALDACVAVGGPQLDAKFRELFTSADPIHRLMAVYAMGKLGLAEHVDEIKLALEDEVPDIRKVALEAFAETCVEVSHWIPVIKERLNDENREVRLTVVELMGHCNDDAMLPYIMQALDDDDDWVRVRAVEAIGARKTPEAVPHLVGLINSESTLLAIKAVEALGNIGGKVAFRALLELSNNDDPELQAATEDALARIQEKEGGELH